MSKKVTRIICILLAVLMLVGFLTRSTDCLVYVLRILDFHARSHDDAEKLHKIIEELSSAEA